MDLINEMNNLVANLEVFENEEFGQVRATTINNEPWFVGKDIAQVLGYAKPQNAIASHVDEEDKTTALIQGTGSNYKSNAVLINESGLYSLILSSKLPNAKKFKRWVTSEVLPAIRKTGGYIATTEEDDDATIMAKALMVAQRTIDSKNKQLEDAKKEIKKKDNVLNQFSISQNTKLVRETAKAISKSNSKIIIGERRLYEKMRNWGWICQGSTEPKQYAIDRGYLEVNEGTKSTSKGVFTYRTTRVTGKGEVKIVEKLLKENEIVSDFYS